MQTFQTVFNQYFEIKKNGHSFMEFLDGKSNRGDGESVTVASRRDTTSFKTKMKDIDLPKYDQFV